jgi:Arc/MetJ family transcription regulator
MTMHIDEEVLARVMKVTGAKTKTQAVKLALSEMARRQKLKELFGQGLGLTPDELRAEFAPAAEDRLDSQGLRVAEKPGPYGRSRPA